MGRKPREEICRILEYIVGSCGWDALSSRSGRVRLIQADITQFGDSDTNDNTWPTGT